MEETKVAYATDFAGETTSIEELYQTLKDIAQAGFSHIHWCHEWDGDYMYSKAEMEQIREWMAELGLQAKGVHATEGCKRNRDVPNRFHYRYRPQNRRDYTSENEYNRRAGVELVRNRIELAYTLGTDAIVLHMQLPYKSFVKEKFQETYYRQVYKSFDELEEPCREMGVRICVENMIGTPDEWQKEQFDRLFERYDASFVGFCFDTGHGRITGGDGLALARRYQDRLYMMHTNDNHGLQGEECWEDAEKMACCDEHLNLFCGDVDWDGYAKIVAGSPYELPVVMEVGKRNRKAEEFLEESLLAGRKFTKMVLKYRK